MGGFVDEAVRVVEVVRVDAVEPEAWEKTDEQYGCDDGTCNEALWCLAARLVGCRCSSPIEAATAE